MYQDQKVVIYKGIIQYLLDSTKYSLHRIANLSNTPVAYLQMIYQHDRIPVETKVELNLLKLFMIVIDMELKGEWKAHTQLIRQMDLENQ